MKADKIIFATGNADKMREIRMIMADLGMEILSMKEAGITAEIVEDGKTFEENAMIKAKTIAEELKKRGFVLQADGTENHLILIDVMKSYGINGKLYEKALDLIGLTLNANALPGDTGGAFRPNGVRLGTPAITTRGLGVKEMAKIAEWMEEVAKICKEAETEEKLADHQKEFNKLHQEVITLATTFPLPTA